MADPTVLLDPDVQYPCAAYELVVDGQGLALGKRTRDEPDADLVGGRVVGAGPDDLANLDTGRVELGHPILPVLWTVVGARKSVAGGIEFHKDLLLRGQGLPPLELLGRLTTHGSDQILLPFSLAFTFDMEKAELRR